MGLLGKFTSRSVAGGVMRAAGAPVRAGASAVDAGLRKAGATGLANALGGRPPSDPLGQPPGGGGGGSVLHSAAAAEARAHGVDFDKPHEIDKGMPGDRVIRELHTRDSAKFGEYTLHQGADVHGNARSSIFSTEADMLAYAKHHGLSIAHRPGMKNASVIA